MFDEKIAMSNCSINTVYISYTHIFDKKKKKDAIFKEKRKKKHFSPAIKSGRDHEGNKRTKVGYVYTYMYVQYFLNGKHYT